MTTALTCEQVTSHLPDGRPQALKTDLAVPGLSTVQFPNQGPNPGPQHWELEVPGPPREALDSFLKMKSRNSLRVPFRNMSRLGTGRAGKVDSCVFCWGLGWGIVSGWCFLFSLWKQRPFEIVCVNH